MNKWIFKETDANLKLMSEVLGISKIVAKVMANRNIRSKNTALAFLQASNAKMRPLFDPLLESSSIQNAQKDTDSSSHAIPKKHDAYCMKDAKIAITRIAQAIKNDEKIVIFGDYDVDGITSTAVILKVLSRLSKNVSYYIPNRVNEGYGLNLTAIDMLNNQGTKLILTVDNGISAIEEIKHAKLLGIDTIIIDHHEQGESLPEAVAVVNPKQLDCPYPFKEMCACGLVYKVVESLCAYLDVDFIESDECLVLATIATICDIVPLKDENRIIVSMGLSILNKNKFINPGLGTLINIRGYIDKPIDTFAIGFVLGPCINAAGRLDSASKAVDLFMCDVSEGEKRTDLTTQLITLNNERKNHTSECVERLLDTIQEKPLDKILVLVDTKTHESIAGIVAGRIRESTGRPTIIITSGATAMKGSGRSNKNYNMFEALSAQSHLLDRFGGHFMAAGLTIKEENVDELRTALNNNCTLSNDDFYNQLEIDDTLNLNDITIGLANELSMLAPFGSGNYEPLFVSHNALVDNVRAIDDKNTLIFTFQAEDGSKVKGIAFGLNQNFANLNIDTPTKFYLNIVYCVELNVYNGNTSVQLRIRDFKQPEEVY